MALNVDNKQRSGPYTSLFWGIVLSTSVSPVLRVSTMSKDEHDSLGEPKFELQVAQKEEPLEEPGTKPVQGPTFPDGGFRAWMTIVSCFLLSFTSYGQLNAYGVFQTYYIENQLADHSAADIAWIGNIQLGLMYLGGIVSGWAFDSYGSRTLLIIGWLLSTFSLMMLSLAKRYYQIILSQGLGLGLGIAIQFYPLLSVPNHWFMRRRAFALGIVVAGSSLSGVIFPIMLSKLFQSIGFPWTVRTLAFMCFALQGISIPFVKERFPPRAGVPLIDRSVYKDKPFLLHVISGFFIAFGLYTPFWYIELYALREKISANLAFYLISIMNAAGLLGRVSLGHVADRLGRFNIMICTIFLCIASVFAIWITSHTAVELIFFALIFGFTSGAYLSISPSCTVQLTSDTTKIGSRVGIFMTGMAPGILTGPSIAGALLSTDGGSYVGLQCFIGAFISASAVFAIMARLAGQPDLKQKF